MPPPSYTRERQPPFNGIGAFVRNSEEASRLLTMSTDRTYSIMRDYRMGDEHVMRI